MPANANAIEEDATIAEHIRLRRPRIQPIPSPPSPPPPQIPSLVQSTGCKSSISSLFLSTFSNTITNDNIAPTANINNNTKKKNFTSSKFRGLGCAAASPQVSVPAVIKTSADWEARKVRKKKQKMKKNGKLTVHQQLQEEEGEEEEEEEVAGMENNQPSLPSLLSCSSSNDVWCGPGVVFNGADDASPVDCVVNRRNVSARGKIDAGDNSSHRERSFPARRTASREHVSILDFDSAFGPAHPESDVFRSRYCHHARHRSPEGLAEILMLQSSLLMGGRLDSHDRFREWRLNIDGMTYEELLALGDRIGYVSTGLKENEINSHLRKIKLSVRDKPSSHLPKGMGSKCSICQEEYEADDEMGKLKCGHAYHMPCIKQWLLQKNACPVCKSQVVARR